MAGLRILKVDLRAARNLVVRHYQTAKPAAAPNGRVTAQTLKPKPVATRSAKPTSAKAISRAASTSRSTTASAAPTAAADVSTSTSTSSPAGSPLDVQKPVSSTTASASGGAFDDGPVSLNTFYGQDEKVSVWKSYDTTGASEDWSTSFSGLGSASFSREAIDILTAELKPEDIEITPDGMIFLPEIKYRRILNRAFGPGGWGMAPRSDTLITPRTVTREYGLICQGRLVAIARGEQDYFDEKGIPTSMEGCKSNALMRCCKDLGIASELWDPTFIKKFKDKYCTKDLDPRRKRYLWKRK